MRMQSLRDRVIRVSLEQVLYFVPPPGELGVRHLRLGALVHHVVDLPAERVERRDRAAALGGQEQERVIEARPARRRLLLAVLVGCHKALKKRSGQSKGPRTGRRRNMSYPACASFSRI